MRQHEKASGQLRPMNIRIQGQDGFRDDTDGRGPRQEGLTHIATTPLTPIWAPKPWNGQQSDGTTPRPVWTPHPQSVQSIIGQEQNNKATQIHVGQSESGRHGGKQVHADEGLTGNRWQIATPTSSEESSWLHR